MSFKLVSTNGSNKLYLYPKGQSGVPNREWEYVSADAATDVDGSAYISSGSSDGDAAIGMLKIGDRIWATQVASIDDTRTIAEDCKSGVSDVSLHVVLDNTGSIIDLSDDILAGTVTYGD